MGKFNYESEDEGMAMDIQQPQKTQSKKKKLILKSKKLGQSQNQAQNSSSNKNKRKSIIAQFARKVNLKKQSVPLAHKQQIFHKIVKGLSQKSEVSKKNKKKNRVLLKKELRKFLQQEHIHRKKSTEGMGQEPTNNNPNNTKNPEKFKKKQIDQRQKATQFHQLMGAGLQNIKRMIAKNTSHLGKN